MTTLAVTHPTLLDLTRRLDPDGNIDAIAEMLSQTNEILDDMVWVEGNLPTGHRSTVRTGLPAPTWRKMYGGVQPTKSRTVQVTDTCGMLENYSEVDKALADLNGNTAAFRLSEDRAVIEGMNQEFASTLFYGDESLAPEEFTGLSPRYSSTSAENARNVVLAGGVDPDSTDNASIWLIVWGPNTVHGIYPKGSKVGLMVEDKGQVTIESIDGAGGRMEAYRTHYRWDVGLCVRDWRYAVRCHFDYENVIASGATGPVLYDLMGTAMRRVPSLNMGRAAFYASSQVLELLDQQANYKGNSNLAFTTIEGAQGRLISSFRGIPIRRCDALLVTESDI